MSVISNLYAAKLYSEHPLAIWPLDDDVSYISLISNQQRTFEADSPYPGWTINNGTANDNLPLPDIKSPFDSDIYSGIEGDVPLSDGTDIEAISPGIFAFEDCNQDLKTFSISFYMYQDSAYVNYYEFGYKYYDDILGQWIEVLKTVDAPSTSQWIRFQDTFIIDEFDSDLCYLVIRANVDTGGSSGDYNFIFNGITVGQWSEATSSQSLGATSESAPVSSGISNPVIRADQYGFLTDYSYYVVEDNKLLAKNCGVPMVFGSENVTRIFPSSDETPSLIFPSEGLLTEDGRYKDYTLEFWLKIRPSTTLSRKIIGPIDSNDGIYVSEGFITLVIDNKFSSHNISEWYRPMIIHLTLKRNTASMLINGEQVAQIEIDRSSMTLPTSNTWFGVISYEDISIFEIDCISIFPYALPTELARKRFVWGQGTDTVQLINDSFDGEEAVIDFTTAKYVTNKVYPDVERWDAGYYNNMIATTNSLSVPQYSLPTIFLGGRDLKEWYEDNNSVNDIVYPLGDHPKFITFRPNIVSGSWEPVSGTNWTDISYLNFPSLSFLANPITAMYGIFEVESEIASKRTLIEIFNILNGKSFSINIEGYDVTYEFDGQELPGTGFTTAADTHFAVGINFADITDSFNYELSSFFGSPELLTMYVGGNGLNTFEGKIYRVGFADQNNYNLISQHFLSNGIVDYEDDELLEAHFASYTLKPFYRYGAFFLDISVQSQWEEYYPLSYFASYVTKRDGSTAYDLDYLQFNFGYPSLIEIVETIVDNPNWIYQELFDAYNDPIQKSYEILDNSALSGYTDYASLASNLIVEYEIDTSGSSLDSYVTFQLLAEGADEPLSSFTHTKNLTDSYTVYAGDENTNLDPYKAYKTKFRVVDGTIIYPPKNINFNNVAMVVHFDINQDGIISNPLKIKDLQITSRALNDSLTPIGTQSGLPIYPYVKSGIYYSGKERNPVIISKDSMPYLYLTEKSGIKVLQTDAEKEYGVIVPINLNKSSDYLLGATQIFLKYDIFSPPPTTSPIFSLTHKDGTIEFVVRPDETGDRFIISARDKITKQIDTNVYFYQNGISVVNPYVTRNEWNILGIYFLNPLDVQDFSGSLNILYGVSAQNISFFRSTGLNEFITIVPRIWDDVLYGDQEPDPLNIVDWEFWKDLVDPVSGDPYEWKNVYVFDEERRFSTTPEEIYKTYTGTNFIVSDDNTGFSIAEDDFTTFTEVSWNEPSYISKPA